VENPVTFYSVAPNHTCKIVCVQNCDQLAQNCRQITISIRE